MGWGRLDRSAAVRAGGTALSARFAVDDAHGSGDMRSPRGMDQGNRIDSTDNRFHHSLGRVCLALGSSADRLQDDRSASVGDTRAARIAGYSPAAEPITNAAAIPPISAVAGMITRHPCNVE